MCYHIFGKPTKCIFYQTTFAASACASELNPPRSLTNEDSQGHSITADRYITPNSRDTDSLKPGGCRNIPKSVEDAKADYTSDEGASSTSKSPEPSASMSSDRAVPSVSAREVFTGSSMSAMSASRSCSSSSLSSSSSTSVGTMAPSDGESSESSSSVSSSSSSSSLCSSA